MDRSKYRNPDMPVGYVKKKPQLQYKQGIEIDGIHYNYLGYIIGADVFGDDIRELSKVDYSLFEDDDDEINVVQSSVSVKEEVIDDDEENDGSKRIAKNKKKEIEEISRNKKEDKIEKTKKIKKVKKEFSDDCSSELSSHSTHKQSLVKNPPSLSPECYSEVKIKEEFEEPSHLHGYYNCDVCNITMNSLSVYNTHVNGKRHLKNLKLKNVKFAVFKAVSSAATEGLTKYPKPPSGVVRKKVKIRAKIQDVIERRIKSPCPGLYLVTEIQGIIDTQYYCNMCDSICSTNSIIPHLIGYKHRLRSLKHFKPGEYEEIHGKPKHEIETQLVSILNAVQKKEGLGRMAVEVEEHFSKDMEITGSQPSTSRNEAGPSFRNSGMEFTDFYDITTVPDTSSSDFFCKICHSHMNSQQMWEAHVRGKRHLTNLKKMPGDRPSGAKNVSITEPSRLVRRLNSERIFEPIVGLHHIQELWITETGSESYHCFLCGAGLTSFDVIDHLLSYKHRTKFLDKADYHGREVILNMHERAAYPLVEQMCADYEQKHGRSKPTVCATKGGYISM